MEYSGGNRVANQGVCDGSRPARSYLLLGPESFLTSAWPMSPEVFEYHLVAAVIFPDGLDQVDCHFDSF